MILYQTIQDYAAAGTPIGVLEAINITGLVGDKGGDFFTCGLDRHTHTISL